MLYLLLDSREARWLPTVLANKYDKACITVGLGFDSYVIVRHGISPAIYNKGKFKLIKTFTKKESGAIFAVISSHHKTQWKTGHWINNVQSHGQAYHSFHQHMLRNCTFHCSTTNSNTKFGHMRTQKNWSQQIWGSCLTTWEATCQTLRQTYCTGQLSSNVWPAQNTFWMSTLQTETNSCWVY